MLSSRSLGIAACVLVVAAGAGCDSCKKKQEQVKKELAPIKKTITEVPFPNDALGELVIRDPESFIKHGADGAGLGPMVGDSPYQKLIDSISDENAKKAVKAIDPHGAIAAILIAKIAPGEKPHGVVAARLKDPDVAAAALDAASKTGGNLKTWQSKVLDSTVYEPGNDGEVAVYGDVVVVADTRDALEAGAKYVAWRSANKLDHELVLRVPMEKIGPTLKTLGLSEWAKVKPNDLGSPKVKAEIDPLVDPVLTGVADMGDVLVNVDLEGDFAKLDEKVVATKSLSAWLSKYPTGDASALLTMPKAESASLYRFPDGLGPAAYAGIDYGLESSTLTPAERADASKQARELGKALGHQVVYVTDTGKGGTGVNTEILVRFDVDDPAAVKTSAPALVKLALKAAGGKPVVAAYKKFGAEGDTVTTAATLGSLTGGAGGATKDTWTWALKGSQLYLSACLGCTPVLLDAALDPASKSTIGDDPAAKAKIGEFPAKGIVSASYGTSLSFPGMTGGMGMFMGAPPPAKKPGVAMWGWSTAAPDGITAKGAVPLSFIGDLLKGYLMIAGMGGMGGPGGMGGAPPPF